MRKKLPPSFSARLCDLGRRSVRRGRCRCHVLIDDPEADANVNLILHRNLILNPTLVHNRILILNHNLNAD